MMLSELVLPRFEEIVEKYTCELRQQMSRSNNGVYADRREKKETNLVSLFSRLSVW